MSNTIIFNNLDWTPDNYSQNRIHRGKCIMKHSHNLDGSVNNTNRTYIKDNNLYLLNGYETISVDCEYKGYKFKTGKEMYFKRGWYNSDLEFVEEVSDEDQKEINEILPF